MSQPELSPALIRAALTTVKYPGFSRDIVSFGLVKDITVSPVGAVVVELLIESKNADVPRFIYENVMATVKELPGVKKLDVNIEHHAPKSNRVASNDDPADWKSSVPGVKHVIAVSSGKGGVGKSTVSANLAVGLSRLGFMTGLLVLDIYGPSMALMFGTKERPGCSDKEQFLPVDAHGVKLLSMALLVDGDTPLAVRGPLATRYVQQFLRDVEWGGLDFLILDMPPGTGDVPLTVFQSIPVDGIIIVTSPQELVSMIVEKAVNMAKMMNVPVLGFVENYSYLQCPDCGKQIEVFGKSKLDTVAKKFDLPILARLPIDPKVAEAFDEGRMEEINTDALVLVIEKIG